MIDWIIVIGYTLIVIGVFLVSVYALLSAYGKILLFGSQGIALMDECSDRED